MQHQPRAREPRRQRTHGIHEPGDARLHSNAHFPLGDAYEEWHYSHKSMKNLSFDRCRLISEFVAGKDVLDIGCVEHNLENRRKGKWLHEHICKSAASTLGLDYEAAEIEKMKAEGYKVIAADATSFDLGRQFDVIVAGETLEHILNAHGFLSCIRRHLRADGRLLLTTPNANCLIYFAENLLLGREIDNPDHVAIYSPTTMAKLLSKCGFSVERFVFLAENTAYCHESSIAKALVHLKQGVQVTFGLVRPSLCHHFITIAKSQETS